MCLLTGKASAEYLVQIGCQQYEGDLRSGGERSRLGGIVERVVARVNRLVFFKLSDLALVKLIYSACGLPRRQELVGALCSEI